MVAAETAEAEKLAVYDRLRAELSASEEIEQLATYLLAFDGAAAAIVLGNSSELDALFGREALTVALVALALAGAFGLAVKWLGLRIRAFCRVMQESRKLAESDRAASGRRIQDLSKLAPEWRELPATEAEAVQEVRRLFESAFIDEQVVAERFMREYASTLGWIGRWWGRRQSPGSGAPMAHLRILLRRQYRQRVFLLIQIALSLGLVVAAACRLGLGVAASG